MKQGMVIHSRQTCTHDKSIPALHQSKVKKHIILWEKTQENMREKCRSYGMGPE
jgi:hypothetical protein